LDLPAGPAADDHRQGRCLDERAHLRLARAQIALGPLARLQQAVEAMNQIDDLGRPGLR